MRPDEHSTAQDAQSAKALHHEPFALRTWLAAAATCLAGAACSSANAPPWLLRATDSRGRLWLRCGGSAFQRRVTGGNGQPTTAALVELAAYGYIEEESFIEGDATAYDRLRPPGGGRPRIRKDCDPPRIARRAFWCRARARGVLGPEPFQNKRLYQPGDCRDAYDC
jgi:hypothetical protein